MGEPVMPRESTRSPRPRSSALPPQLTDTLYASLARETKQRINWRRILREVNTSSLRWKWLENNRNFSVYTKDSRESSGQYVFATGVVNASVHEIASLLSASTQQELCDRMAAYHGDDFKHGTYVADIAAADHGTPESQAASTSASASRLAVHLATFASAKWLRRDDAWCYLEETRFDRPHRRFEKVMTTLQPEQVHNGKFDHARLSKMVAGNSKSIRDVVCGYSATEVDRRELNANAVDTLRGACVQLHFYAEYDVPRVFGRFVQPKGRHDASAKAVKQRLVRLARNCDRLSQLVLRRRLGVQALVDKQRVRLVAHKKCVNCERVRLAAKQCRVCGHTVCSDCSDKYERETRRVGSELVHVEKVRVCDSCLARLHVADYSNITDAALNSSHVLPDRVPASGERRSASQDLKTLLHDALLNAPSQARKEALVSVIKCVLDQERTEGADEYKKRAKTLSISSSRSTANSTSSDTDRDNALSMLDDLTVPTIPYEEAPFVSRQGRVYSLNPHNESAFPIPDNEAQRLRVIDDLGVASSFDCQELDIICDLAAKEMGAMASIVSVITADQQRVIGANNPVFRTMHVQREASFCTHTIMDDKPLIVPHPEADYRVSHIAKNSKMGVRFYCGFPLLAEDNTVIGSLCCVDQQTREMTESQYSAMQRLALTAAKVVQLEGARRKRTLG